MLILVTGATGKVGRRFIAGLLDDPRFSKARIRALCHNRLYEATERVDVFQGSIADRDVVAAALDDVTHVVHLATCKETPSDVMDVTVKGLFWLLEEFRTSVTACQ
ncbi:NAD-dependent epimerase/dehydratase family protein, partial [Rhizobium ruizarguesonis]